MADANLDIFRSLLENTKWSTKGKIADDIENQVTVKPIYCLSEPPI